VGTRGVCHRQRRETAGSRTVYCRTCIPARSGAGGAGKAADREPRRRVSNFVGAIELAGGRERLAGRKRRHCRLGAASAGACRRRSDSRRIARQPSSSPRSGSIFRNVEGWSSLSASSRTSGAGIKSEDVAESSVLPRGFTVERRALPAAGPAGSGRGEATRKLRSIVGIGPRAASCSLAGTIDGRCIIRGSAVVAGWRLI
jgi:hypothetical protein